MKSKTGIKRSVIISAFAFSFFILSFAQSVFASSLNLYADETDISSDDIATIRLSVDGQVDDNQVSISGLDNFTIVGRSSSQKVNIINGRTLISQEQVFSLQPIRSGTFAVQAIAKDGGKEIKSDKIIFHISKSLIQSTKDKLLGRGGVSASVDNQDDAQNGVTNNTSKKDEIKKLLIAPQNTQDGTGIKGASSTLGQNNEGGANFPKVQYISAFNSWFWLEFFGIIFLVLVIVLSIFYIHKKSLKNGDVVQ